MTATLLDIDDASYHADDIGHDRPSLSASIATVLANESPYHAWLAHPKLGNVRREVTPEMAKGSLIHALVFGQPTTDFEIIVADNYRTKLAQTVRDDAIAAGRIPILQAAFDAAISIADGIRQRIEEAGFPLDGNSEQAVMWEEKTAHGPILCRGKMDHVNLDTGLIIDLKTTSDASPRQITRSVIDHGYDIQFGAYTSAFRAINPGMAGREEFVWLFVEMLPESAPDPCILTVARPDGSMRECGRARWRTACETWAKCLTQNQWPGYGSVRIECPDWMLKQLVETE